MTGKPRQTKIEALLGNETALRGRAGPTNRICARAWRQVPEAPALSRALPWT